MCLLNINLVIKKIQSEFRIKNEIELYNNYRDEHGVLRAMFIRFGKYLSFSVTNKLLLLKLQI